MLRYKNCDYTEGTLGITVFTTTNKRPATVAGLSNLRINQSGHYETINYLEMLDWHTKLLGIQLFLDTCCLTRQFTQVIKLRFANITTTLNFDRVNQW